MVFTLAGFLHPGYSPIQHVISDLGVGPDGWILNTDLIVSGLLFIIFAIGFYQWMRQVINYRWLLAGTTLLVLSGAGVVNEGIFHQPAHGDPAAHLHMLLHNIGLAVLFYSLIRTARKTPDFSYGDRRAFLAWGEDGGTLDIQVLV